MGDVNKLKDFAVDQLGVPPGMVDFLEDAAGWAKNGIAIYGFATAALDIADKLFGDKEPSVQQLIAGLDAKLDTLISTTNTILNGQLQAQFVEKASTISARRSALKSRQAMVEDFQQAPTPQRFTDLTSSLDTTLAEILNELLDADFNKLPITKSSYDAGADWFYGGGLWPWYRSSNEFFQVRVQVLQPTNFKPTGKLPPGYQPVQDKPFNASDKPRVLYAADVPMINGKPVDKVEYRWDGRFTLPTIIYGFTVLEAALRRVEPHFRSTGFYRAHLAVMLGALNTYLAEWAGSLVWTSEMPATLPGGTPIGFQQYPCQVVDPVFGVSARQDDFWYSDHNVGLATGASTAHDPDALPFGLTEADQALETWTAEDRAEFLARRAQLLSRVTHDSGWWSLATYGTNLARFLEPPTESECVEVFNDKRQRSFPAFRKGVKGQNTPVSVETNGSPFSDPQTFVGQLRTRAVKTSVPVTIQPNPVPSGKVRTAASDVEFGYRVAVAAGGPGKPVEVFSRPLRRAIGEPGIYHDAQNKLRKPFPYTIKTTVTIAASTSTILVNKQGTKRLQHGKKETHDVTFTCRVTVGDPGSPGVADTEQDPGRGFINVEILSTDPDAQSYEVTFAVTETVPAVPSPGTSNTSLSTYVVHGVLPVDARVIELPEAYFDAVEQEEAERAQLQQMLEHAHRKYAPVLAPISRPPKGDPFGELLVLLRDPGLASAIGVEAQRVLGRRLAQRELTALVQRAGSLARREASATSLVRPELPRLRGQRIDLLAPLPAPGLTAEAALATEEGSA